VCHTACRMPRRNSPWALGMDCRTPTEIAPGGLAEHGDLIRVAAEGGCRPACRRTRKWKDHPELRTMTGSPAHQGRGRDVEEQTIFPGRSRPKINPGGQLTRGTTASECVPDPSDPRPARRVSLSQPIRDVCVCIVSPLGHSRRAPTVSDRGGFFGSGQWPQRVHPSGERVRSSSQARAAPNRSSGSSGAGRCTRAGRRTPVGRPPTPASGGRGGPVSRHPPLRDQYVVVALWTAFQLAGVSR
jgi:hypothetical protein